MCAQILDHCICKPRDYNPNYPPAVGNGTPYTVSEGESFASIAASLATKYRLSSQSMAKLLLMHNFKTVSPNEINFYLEHNLGCTRLTRDRANYVFTPGQVIYLPPLSAIRKELEGTGVWFGIGAQWGGILVGGAQRTFAYMVSIEAPLQRNFILEIGPTGKGMDQLNRLGVGVGGGVGAVVVIVTSLFGDPTSELDGLPVGGDKPEITVSLGERWDSVLKTAVDSLGKSKRLTRIAEFMSKAKALASRYPKFEKYLKPAQIEALANGVKDIAFSGALGMKTDGEEPEVKILPLPISASVELSISVNWGYCQASNYKDTTGILWKRPMRAARPKSRGD